MANKYIKIIALGVATSLLLTGCAEVGFDDETLQRISHIGDNINTISTKFAEHSDELNNDIASAQETAQELAEAVTIDEDVEDSVDEEILGELDEIEVDEIDEDFIKNRIKENLLAELLKYKDQGQEIIERALAKRDDGIIMINEGVNEFIKATSDIKRTDKIADRIGRTFDSTQEVIEGANEVAAGAAIIVNEASAWAEDIVSTAQSVGINSKELEEAKRVLDKASRTKLEFISQESQDKILEYKDKVMDSIPAEGTFAYDIEDIGDLGDYDLNVYVDPDSTLNGYYEDAYSQAMDVLDEADKAMAMAEELYSATNEAAIAIIDGAKESGISEESVAQIEELLDGYQEVVGGGISITNDLSNIKKDMNKAIKHATDNELIKYYLGRSK